MDDLTLILVLATFICFGGMLKISNKALSAFAMIVGVCGISAVLQDGSISDNTVYLLLLPLITIVLYSIVKVSYVGGAR